MLRPVGGLRIEGTWRDVLATEPINPSELSPPTADEAKIAPAQRGLVAIAAVGMVAGVLGGVAASASGASTAEAVTAGGVVAGSGLIVPLMYMLLGPLPLSVYMPVVMGASLGRTMLAVLLAFPLASIVDADAQRYWGTVLFGSLALMMVEKAVGIAAAWPRIMAEGGLGASNRAVTAGGSQGGEA